MNASDSKKREASMDIAKITDNTDIGYDDGLKRLRSNSPVMKNKKVLKK